MTQGQYFLNCPFNLSAYFRFCGYGERPSAILNSTGSEMLVIFKSNYTMQIHNYMRGFKAKIVTGTFDLH